MATYLYRLGAWSFEHRRRVLMIWLAVLVLIGASAAAFSGRTSDKFSVPGHRVPAGAGPAGGEVPRRRWRGCPRRLRRAEGETLADPANRKAMEASIAKAEHAAEVDTVIPPFAAGTITEDERVAFADVIYPVPADKIDDEARDELAAVAKPARPRACRSSSAAGS